MFVVELRFGEHRDRARELMGAHKDWIEQGFAEGVFLLTGSLAGQAGGVVIAHGTTRAALEVRLAGDPFVAQGVVTATIIDIQPGRVDARLNFLLEAVG